MLFGGHSTRHLDMVVHCADFIIAGTGDDLDWPSQTPGFDSEAAVLNRCVTTDAGLTQDGDP